VGDHNNIVMTEPFTDVQATEKEELLPATDDKN
jgi:hypothetical protein